MKIKLSKSRWEQIGTECGWIRKKAQTAIPISETGPDSNTAQVYQKHKNENNPNVPQQQSQQSQQAVPNASGWSFNKLMQDPNFKSTFETIKSQRQNEKKILKYWQSIGIQYQSIPEIIEIIG